MSLVLSDPSQVVDSITAFIKKTFQAQGKQRAVIAISGGIDSALALTLLAQSLPKDNIFPVFLPYGAQPIEDSQLIAEFTQIPKENWQTINIAPIVDAAATQLILGEDARRKGNLMARSRMMVVFDLAKEKDALVCGTENKSEHSLGYFTRFGDAASDVEPICHLYKTQVRQLANFLNIPANFLEKAPSAGLWTEPTDEKELGFSYEIADQVLDQVVDGHQPAAQVTVAGVPPETVQAVIHQVQQNHFKQEVPYSLKEDSTWIK